jgi:hypothetical protein
MKDVGGKPNMKSCRPNLRSSAFIRVHLRLLFCPPFNWLLAVCAGSLCICLHARGRDGLASVNGDAAKVAPFRGRVLFSRQPRG